MILLFACAPDPKLTDSDPTESARVDTAETGDTRDSATDSADSAGDTGETAIRDTADTSGRDTGPPASGRLALDLDEAEPRLVGTRELQSIGTTISVGDGDGDGAPDILVQGGYQDLDAWIQPADFTGVQRVGDQAFSGGDSYSCSSGKCVGAYVHDVDGDGYDDALFGMRSEGTGGAAYLMLGPFTEARYVFQPDASLTAEGYVELGFSVGSGDFDADGLSDLLVGSPADITGYAYVIYGPAEGERDVTEADASLHGVTTAGEAGTIVASAGDIDGDGNDDILVGTEYQASTVFVVSGPVHGAVDLWDADRSLTIPALDAAAAADLDGDGTAELVLGSGRDVEDSGFRGVGHAWVFSLDTWTTADEDDAIAVLEGEWDYPGAGNTLSPAGDTNADGYGDLLVGATHDTWYGGTAAYLVLGPVSGSLALADAPVRLEADSDSLEGMQLAAAGDIDLDGLDDLVVAAPSRTEAGRQAGTVWPVMGADLR